MNPHQVSQSVNTALVKQMRRTRPLEQHDDELSAELRRLYEGDENHEPGFRFVSPPYVERLRYYKQGQHSSLDQLVKDGVLEQECAELFAKYFGRSKPGDVRLYTHQAEAARRIARGENVMVCTGTGSGKTESFLLPVINGIIKERKRCKEDNVAYTPGVRAMILYPMNALVNDQLMRLRRLLKLAADIEYAQDITFGYYTGELDAQADRGSAWVRELRNRENKDLFFPREEAGECDHAYLNEEETANNEYVKRSWWTHRHYGPADILITNYSMLERLLLDPDKRAIFSPDPQTWKYIVVDEAHTYTGSLGTEISWLLRRLLDRVSEGGIACQDNGEAKRRIQFIATSATISAGENAADLAREFARDIFRCRGRKGNLPGDNFAVLTGETYKAGWETNEDRNLPAGAYASLLEAQGIDLSSLLKGSYLEKLMPLGSSLFEQTKWLNQAHAWLGRFDYLEQFEKRPEKKKAALGDLLALCSCLKSLGLGDREMVIKSNNSLLSLQKLLYIYQDKDPSGFQRKLRNITGTQLKSALQTLEKAIRQFCEETGEAVTLRAPATLPLLANVLLSLQEEYNKSLGEDVAVARWQFEWDASFEEQIRQAAEQARSLRSLVERLQEQVAEKWGNVLGLRREGHSARGLITRYILGHRELGEIARLLDEKGYAEEKDILTGCFKMQGGESEFEAFVQLLTLTQDEALPNRPPLMDLRYHQIIHRVEGAAVWFDEQKKLHIVVNEEAEDTVIRDKDGQEHQLYQLGQCYNCGHPYLMLYASGAMEAGRLPRSGETVYRFEADNLSLHAFARCKPGEAATHWLDARNRKVYDKEELGRGLLIPLRLHVYANDTTEGAMKTHISECPHCHGRSTVSAKYGIIGPYHTGSDFARATVIDSLVKLADPEFSIDPKKYPHRGRKLLTFSDSRGQASAIPVEYENAMGDRNVLRLLMECLQKQENTDSEEAFSELVDFLSANNYNSGREDQELDTLISVKSSEIPEHVLRDWISACSAKVSARLKNSPLLLVQDFIERLHKAGGDLLLQKEYSISANGRPGKEEIYDFNECVAALLTMFSLLRTPGRYSAVQGTEPPLRVYSWKHESEKGRNERWLRFEGSCHSPADAERAFQKVYTSIFLNVKGDPTGFDESGFWNYDVERSINGKGGAHKEESFDITPKKFLPLISGYLRDPKVDDAVALRDYLQKDILSDGKIALYDVRVALTEAGRLTLRDEPNEVTVFYEADEHSAQLAKETKRRFQKKFTEGTINILSCTTTFEMGVDVGSLNCVLLCDMPPSVASYRQRAGRAGRRAGSSAYVVTLATGQSHDAHFARNPEEMFFGNVTPPVIYSNNKSFRAKHLRAVALQLFLRWLSAENAQVRWKLSGNFFLSSKLGDSTRNSCISALPKWVAAHRDEVQERCVAITGGPLDYSVADDLCLQIMGLSIGSDPYQGHLPNFAERQKYLELSGPFLPHSDGGDGYNEKDPWTASAFRRYELEVQTATGGKTPEDIMKKENGAHCQHIAYAQTVDVLARFRVLSRYGFPCDVISLRLAARDESRPDKVDLSRDIKQGLYEYAPGQTVLANKRRYTSESSIWLGKQLGKGQQKTLEIDQEQHFLVCRQCFNVRYAEGEDTRACPHCGNEMQRITASRPDAFQAEPSHKANSVPSNQRSPRRRYYLGGKHSSWEISGTNTQASSSDSREIIYLNILPPTKRSEDDPVDALYYAFRTDIVMLSLAPDKAELPPNPNWPDRDRARHLYRAWCSATQAIVKALSQVLGVSPQDIGALTAEVDDRPQRGRRPHIVLFDDTASGSGAMLRLIQGENEQENGQCVALTKRILTTALALCEQCDCFSQYKDQKGIVMTHRDFLRARDEGEVNCQEYRSCYKCLKSYANQSEHEILDARDAAFILRHMLGSEGSGEVAPGQAPSASGHDDSSSPSASPSADCPPGGGEHPRATREQLLFIRACREGSLEAFPPCRVMRDGVITEMRVVRVSQNRVYLSLPGKKLREEEFEFHQLIIN